MSDLSRLFRRAIYNAVDNRGRSGLLGQADGTVVYTDDSGVIHRNMVWVRIINDAGVTEVVAENRSVPLQPGLPVRVAEINGVLTVISVEVRAANIFTGGHLSAVPEHAWTHGRYGPDPVYISGNQFLPLAVRPTNPADMTVTVGEGWYRWDNELYVFDEAASGSLSSYIPTSSGQQHYVIVSLNRATNALVITDGTTTQTPLISAAPFTTTEIQALARSLGLEHYPLAAVRFYYGQTAVRSPDIFKDLRLWGGEVLTQYVLRQQSSDDIVVSESVTVSIP